MNFNDYPITSLDEEDPEFDAQVRRDFEELCSGVLSTEACIRGFVKAFMDRDKYGGQFVEIKK